MYNIEYINTLFPKLQKKRNFSGVAFLLWKNVHHLILDKKSTMRNDKIDMTLDQGQKPRGTGKNEDIKLVFLLRKSVDLVSLEHILNILIG